MDIDLAALLTDLGSPKILVLGDLILDRYIWGDADRVSPEAPVLVLRVDDEEVRLGGAASVASLLRALNAEVVLAGVTGDDPAGPTVRALLADAGIDASAVFCESGRDTTTKDRFIGRAASRHPSQILRVDREVRDPIAPALEDRLIEAITTRLAEVQVVLVSDYGKGVCTPNVLTAVMAEAQQRGVPVFVDPSGLESYDRYRGAALLVPNRSEATQVAGLAVNTPKDAGRAGQMLCAACETPMTLVKLDSEGMILVHAAGTTEFFPARRRHVYDVTGAGDMVLAVVGLCRASGLSWTESIRLANIAAGLEVERFGVTAVSRHEIRAELLRSEERANKVVSLNRLVEIVTAHRNDGKTIVLTNGCFDLLHVGHVTYLEEAARLGDILVVAINSDASVRRCKGPGRPVIRQADRARMMASLGCVAHVLIFEEDTPHEVLRAVRPDILVKGGTYGPGEVVGHELVKAYGGQVRVMGLVEGISTSTIIGDVLARNSLPAVTDGQDR